MRRLSFVLFLLLSLPSFSATQAEVERLYQQIHSIPETKQHLNSDERQAIFDTARNHKVASVAMLPKYDPTALIGFCFGRAMTVQLLARRQGVFDSSIRKLFVIGDLRSGPSPEWRFHVTTLVRGDDRKWYAIDPIMTEAIAKGTPLRMEDWMSTVRSIWDREKKAHFYVTSAHTVIPDLRKVPETAAEKGEHVIEISFDPLKHKGFSGAERAGIEYFFVEPDADLEYFTNVYEQEISERFPFLSLHINGEEFKFNNYFVDLLEDLNKVLGKN
jgi:hypothetical protein